ncbi:MAG: hypothetical protein ACP5EQ_02855, partial [Candidatus Cloacimonadia bacterium]
GFLLLSGATYKKGNSIIFKINEEMEVMDEYMTVGKTFKGDKSLRKAFRSFFATWNALACDQSYVYMGMKTSNTILYCIDLLNRKVNFKITSEYTKSKGFKKTRAGRGFELVAFYNINDVCITNNYIIIMEELGGSSKDIEKNKLPKNYYNNISFYTKEGNYLFSFEDRSIPYSYFGFNSAVEEIDTGFYIYIVSLDESCFYKYKVDFINEQK